MKEFLQFLLLADGFMPHGHCYLWTPGVVWLHVISDALIALAYYSIPIALVYFVRHRKDMNSGWMLLCFAVFILACGTTHLLEIWNVWHSNYWISGGMKALTAAASVPTAILLVRLIPSALMLASPRQLQHANAALQEEIQTRRNAEQRVRELNAELEKRVAERTTELNMANGELIRQMSERKMADERFRLVVEASPNAIVLANAHGRILLVNSGTEKLFGYAREELMGQPVEKLVPARFREAHPSYRSGYVGQAEARPMGHGRDLFALRKDGSEVLVEIGLNPIETPEGPLVLSAIVDITERKRAEEALRASEADFRASFYSSAVGQAQVAPATGKYLRVNPKFCEIVGYSEKEVLGMTFLDLTHPDDRENASAAHDSMVRGEVPEVSREKRYLRKDGGTVWVSVNASLIHDDAGRPLRTLAVVQDITGRKRAEEALLSAEEKFRCLVEQSLVGIYIIQGERFAYVNPKMVEIFGFSAKELTSTSVLDFIAEEDRPLARANIRKRIEGAVDKVRYGLRMLKKDGQVIHVEAHGARAEYHGSPAILGALLDVTEGKRTEDAVRESEARKTVIMESALDCIITADHDGRILEFNPAAQRTFGYSQVEVIGKELAETIIPPGLREGHRRGLARYHATGEGPVLGKRIEVMAMRADGSEFPAELAINAIRVNDRSMFTAYLRDITERTRAEEKLKASLKEVSDLKTALDEHAIVAITDPQGKITYVNDKFCTISKYSREELLGQDHQIINSAYHPKQFIRELWTTIAGGHVWHGEIKNKAKDGTFYWVDTTIVPFLNDQGKPRQYVAIRADITERKRAEESLRESETRFAAFMRFLPGMAFIKDPQLRFLFVNKTIVPAPCPPASEWVGKTVDEVWPNPIPRKNRLDDEAVLERRDVVVSEMTHGEGAGACIVQSTKFPIVLSDGTVLIGGVAFDVTDRRRAEAEIHRLNEDLEQRVVQRTVELETANKELEAFSYSVSHDLRAPLRAVDGFSQAVLEDYGPQLPAEGQRYLEIIRKGAQQMGVLIDDLLTFSRLSRAPLKRRTVNTGLLVRETLDDLTADVEGRRVDIQIGELPPCEGDPALLKQVWLNLLSNALKYTRGREAAVIEIGSREHGDKRAFFVRDNGAGFDMRYVGKLFGVFQRLHRAEDYEGTGVGLAIVQRIVHRHGGRVWADAEVDRGATFSFTLEEHPNV